MRPIRLAALALLLAVLPACEGPRIISGHIRDGAGNPVPRAQLRLNDDLDDEPQAESDSAGWFRMGVFTSVVATRASVRVDAAGYHARTLRLPFRDDVVVVLTPDSVPRHGREWSDPEMAPLFGLHYGIPLRWSYAVALTRGRFSDFEQYAGWFVSAEPGQGGAKARAGYIRYGPRFGTQLSLAALRTWDRALEVAPRQSYAGAEARFFTLPITVTLGAYSRVSGSAPGDARLFSAGVGFGF